MKQATLVGGGQIVLSKTGRPFCVKCGHFLSSKTHPKNEAWKTASDGKFRTTMWCICDCYILFDSEGRPRKLSPIEQFRKEIYGRVC